MPSRSRGWRCDPPYFATNARSASTLRSCAHSCADAGVLAQMTNSLASSMRGPAVMMRHSAVLCSGEQTLTLRLRPLRGHWVSLRDADQPARRRARLDHARSRGRRRQLDDDPAASEGLVRPRPSILEYSVLDDALAAGFVEITEVSEQGSVPDLKFVNRGPTPVLVVDGEAVAGQTRRQGAIRKWRGRIAWDGDLNASRRSRARN